MTQGRLDTKNRIWSVTRYRLEAYDTLLSGLAREV
jgi:hypothetical protein